MEGEGGENGLVRWAVSFRHDCVTGDKLGDEASNQYCKGRNSFTLAEIWERTILIPLIATGFSIFLRFIHNKLITPWEDGSIKIKVYKSRGKYLRRGKSVHVGGQICYLTMCKKLRRKCGCFWDINEESDFMAKYWKCRKCKKDVMVVYDEDIGTYENLRRKELRIGRLILIPWNSIGQDPICVGAHHMLKI
jgi:hypothetical protein